MSNVKLTDFEKFLWDGFKCDESHYSLYSFIEKNYKNVYDKYIINYDYSPQKAIKAIKKISSLSRKKLMFKLIENANLLFKSQQSYLFYDNFLNYHKNDTISFKSINNNGTVFCDGKEYILSMEGEHFPFFVLKENKNIAIFSHFLIQSQEDDENELLVRAVWKNSKDSYYQWKLNKKLLGRFYNAFMSNKILINPEIDENFICVEKLNIHGVVLDRELKNIGF